MKRILFLLLVIYSSAVTTADKVYTRGVDEFVISSCTPPTHREENSEGIAIPITLEELALSTLFFGKNSIVTKTNAEFTRTADIFCNHSEPLSNFVTDGLWYKTATITDTENRESVFSLETKSFEIIGYVIPPSGTRVSTGLIAYWTFNEKSGTTVIDQIGSTDLTLSGNYTWLTGTNGLVMTTGKGVSSGLEIITALKATNKFTLEVWAAPADLIQTGPARIFAITQDPSNHNMHLGQTVDGNISLRLARKTGGTNHYTTSMPLTLNMAHIVYIFDGTYKKVYVDGILIESFTAALDPLVPIVLADSWTDTDMITIANEPNPLEDPDANRFYAGTYKQIALYDRVLTEEEININYNVGANIVEGIMPANKPTNLRFE